MVAAGTLSDKVRGGRFVGCCGYAACPAIARHRNERYKVRGSRIVGCSSCAIEERGYRRRFLLVVCAMHFGFLLVPGNHMDYVGLPACIYFLNLLA